ncbi:MAG: glycosyltransferase [Cytophagaceae bacterium]
MKLIVLVLFFYFSLFYVIQFIQLILITLLKNDPCRKTDQKPFVSILIACRNEEKNIVDCLSSISKLDYPYDKLEVLIGNDNSTDNTAVLVKDFIRDKPNFKLIEITGLLGKAKAKANVLAWLAKEAKGDIYFITDADIMVPSTWIHGMLGVSKNSIGIVSGVTGIKGKGLLAAMQNFEWIYSFGLIKISTDAGLPVTAVGNNMYITADCYKSTGGYENLDFSVTEDFKLFREALSKGWDYRNLLNPLVYAESKPLTYLKDLFKQRKRWMHGAAKLPIILVIVLTVQGIFFPFIISALFFFPKLALVCWLAKIFFQQFFISIVSHKLGRRKFKNWIYAPAFEIYTGVLSVLFMLYYLMPGIADWKGRKY